MKRKSGIKNLNTSHHLWKTTFVPNNNGTCTRRGFEKQNKNMQILVLLPEKIIPSSCFIDVRYADNAVLYDVRFTNESSVIIFPSYSAPSIVDLYCDSNLNSEKLLDNVAVRMGSHKPFRIQTSCLKLGKAVCHCTRKPAKVVKNTQVNFLFREKQVYSKLTLCTQMSV